MVNVKEYVEQTGNYVNVKLVESLQPNERTAVILPGSGWTEFNKGTDKEKKSVYITLSVRKQSYQWTMSRSACKALSDEFGTSETDQWVGAVIKLGISGAGDKRYVTAMVFQLPQQG